MEPRTAKTQPDYSRRRKAIEACFNDCPKRYRLGVCLAAGLQVNMLVSGPDGVPKGIWGGYDEEQREAIADQLAVRREAEAETPGEDDDSRMTNTPELANNGLFDMAAVDAAINPASE